MKYLFNTVLPLVLLTACGPGPIQYAQSPSPGLVAPEQEPHVVYAVTDAGAACKHGGKTVTMAVDLNNNGKLDADDSTFEHVVICYEKHESKKGKKHD